MDGNASIILHYTKMLYPPKITNKTKGDHTFFHLSNRQDKNVPVITVDP